MPKVTLRWLGQRSPASRAYATKMKGTQGRPSELMSSPKSNSASAMPLSICCAIVDQIYHNARRPARRFPNDRTRRFHRRPASPRTTNKHLSPGSSRTAWAARTSHPRSSSPHSDPCTLASIGGSHLAAARGDAWRGLSTGPVVLRLTPSARPVSKPSCYRRGRSRVHTLPNLRTLECEGLGIHCGGERWRPRGESAPV